MNVQGGGAPAWVTVTVWPAMVGVPVRGDAVVFASIENATVPLPLPLTPDVMVSHELLLVAVHVQPVAAVTPLLLVVALGPGVSVVGGIVKVHDGDEPA